MTTDAARAVAERYARFARDEAPGRSKLYADWAAGVAEDSAMATLLARIPAAHRQPPLVFAVTRMLGAPEHGPSHRPTYPAWAAWVFAHAEEVVAECARRRLQTNEPLRCAALLPALSLVPGPIALVELGASAGLCLFPDRYSYRYELSDRAGEEVALDPPEGASSVILHATLRPPALAGGHEPEHEPELSLPRIGWRAGMDLAPLRAADPADRRFLTTLVWPGETGRAARITAALDVVAREEPLLVAGDATDPDAVRHLVSQAPSGLTLVVTTPGLLPHIPRAGRERLAATLREVGARWISIDPTRWHEPQHPSPADFVLTLDGMPLADVDPLGAWVRRRASSH